MHADDHTDCDSDDDNSVRPEINHKRQFLKSLKKTFSSSASKGVQSTMNGNIVAGIHDTTVTGHTHGEADAPVKKLRTLQRYHGGPNQDRQSYMERHSALTKKQLAVTAEQVSIFLTAGMYIKDLSLN